jgi:Cu/Zn superoxide dismutase
VKIVRSAIVLSAAAAVALVPAAAHADTKSHLDPSGDVRSVAYDPNTGANASQELAEPTAKLGDITKVKVAHSASTITFTVRFRDLSKAGFAHLHELAIVTPTRVRYVNVVAAPGHWKGKAYMTKKPNGHKISCSIRHHIDYGDNVVVAKVPKSCLGRPKVVKVGVETFIGYGSKIYYDQGYKTGGGFNDLLTPSPRIHR